MKNKIDDGQMDFFGLLSEYTDDQGATVRVREPKRKVVSREPDRDFVQLTIDFGKKAEPEKPEPIKEEPKEVKTEKSEPVKPESVKKVPEKIETEKIEIVKEEPKKVEPEPIKEEPIKEEPIKEKPKEVKPEKSEPVKEEPKQLFKDCSRCWCHDCKHNLYNEAVPRELAGRMIPCPACKTCEEEGNASLCEIGNAKEGCRLRALEEGIIIPETEEI